VLVFHRGQSVLESAPPPPSPRTPTFMLGIVPESTPRGTPAEQAQLLPVAAGKVANSKVVKESEKEACADELTARQIPP
jgi:hypothetical protein